MSTFRRMLSGLGVEVVTETAKELAMRCPFHEDSHPSFYVNKETGAWMCHAGCGAGSFFDLYEKLQTLDLEHPPVRTETPSDLHPVDVGVAPLIERGFTPAMLNNWDIVYNEDVKAIELPCYGVDGRFIGYIYRMAPGVQPKYKHPAGFKKSEILFGLHKLLPMGVRKEVFLTEGPLDAIWMQEAGYSGVAIMGSRLAAGQVSILYDLGIRQMTLCFDNDEAGRMATALATEALQRSGAWVWRLPIPARYKDMQEIPIKQIPALIARRHVCVNGRNLLPQSLIRWWGHELENTDATSPWRYQK